MRVLIVANPALGHVLPILPLAIALRDTGHEVAFLTGSSMAGPLAGAGLRHVVGGPPDLPTAFAQVPERAGLTGRRLAMVTWQRGFGVVIARAMAAAVLDLAGEWRPDVVLHDDAEQGAWVAAERLGVPHVAVQATAWRGRGIRLSDAPLNELRAHLGLEADPGLARWHRHGFLATRPASLQDPSDPLPGTAVPMRPIAIDEVDGETPGWLDRAPGGPPRVAVTLGTILPGRLDTMAAILDGLQGLDVEVVATVGPGLDPAALGTRPPRIHVERYVPMSRLLPTCDALVFHGGSGTMMAGLAAGLPLVVLPVAADQPENADRCLAAGVGLAPRTGERDAASIARATREILEDPAYRAAARGVAADIAAMPPPERLVPALVALAEAGRSG
ncbi:MAG TPA: glycosyltransferase, partial [Candidatus Limnocylindrales bacterium]|nr:glycosyltransferase [Candidatus Limnocylindrales bacterium]